MIFLHCGVFRSVSLSLPYFPRVGALRQLCSSSFYISMRTFSSLQTILFLLFMAFGCSCCCHGLHIIRSYCGKYFFAFERWCNQRGLNPMGLINELRPMTSDMQSAHFECVWFEIFAIFFDFKANLTKKIDFVLAQRIKYSSMHTGLVLLSSEGRIPWFTMICLHLENC